MDNKFQSPSLFFMAPKSVLANVTAPASGNLPPIILPEKQATIGDRKYRFRKLPARDAQRLLLKVTQTIGDPIAYLAQVRASSQFGAAASVIGAVLAKLDPSVVEYVQEELFKFTSIVGDDGTSVQVGFESFDASRPLMELYEVTYLAIFTTYGDFIDAVRSHLSAQETKKTGAATATATSAPNLSNPQT